jgi:hypothetical protein
VLSEASALFHKNTGGRYSPHHLPSVFNDLRSLCEPPSKGQIAIQAAADSSAYKVPEHRQVAGEQKRAARRICPSLRPTNAAKPLQNSANPCSSLRKGTEYSFALLRADAILRFVKEPVVSAGRIFFAALQLAQGAFETPRGFLQLVLKSVHLLRDVLKLPFGKHSSLGNLMSGAIRPAHCGTDFRRDPCESAFPGHA